jgi:hypothetical protein
MAQECRADAGPRGHRVARTISMAQDHQDFRKALYQPATIAEFERRAMAGEFSKDVHPPADVH